MTEDKERHATSTHGGPRGGSLNTTVVVEALELAGRASSISGMTRPLVSEVIGIGICNQTKKPNSTESIRHFTNALGRNNCEKTGEKTMNLESLGTITKNTFFK